MVYEKEQNKEDGLSLSWEAISFIRTAVAKKQDLLSYDSQMDDKRIYQQVELLENMVKAKKISLPIDFCIQSFRKMNKDYAERNVAGTGIGKLGCFLIDYVLQNTELTYASQGLYPKRRNENRDLIQYEWYNHTIAGLMDLALERKKNCISQNRKNILYQKTNFQLEKN